MGVAEVSVGVSTWQDRVHVAHPLFCGNKNQSMLRSDTAEMQRITSTQHRCRHSFLFPFAIAHPSTTSPDTAMPRGASFPPSTAAVGCFVVAPLYTRLSSLFALSSSLLARSVATPLSLHHPLHYPLHYPFHHPLPPPSRPRLFPRRKPLRSERSGQARVSACDQLHHGGRCRKTRHPHSCK